MTVAVLLLGKFGV